MDLAIRGLRVLVTAGASGIGLATARAFAREGARVHVCDVDADGACTRSRRATPPSPRASATSPTRPAVARLFDAGDRDASAASTRWSTTPASPDRPPRAKTSRCADWERTLAVNLTGQFLCAQRAIPLLKTSRNASIANLSSAAGRFGFPMRTPYAASKWGVIGLTKSLSIELGRVRHPRQRDLPGSVAGPRIDAVFAQQGGRARRRRRDVVRDEALAKTSLRRLVSADDIANAIVFLASPLGANISGTGAAGRRRYASAVLSSRFAQRRERALSSRIRRS